MKGIAYNGGYKYQLKQDYSVPIEIRPAETIETDYIRLDLHGLLTIRNGYAWDGPSGPTIDTLSFMRGALVHDALYQLMRESHLDHAVYRATADEILRQICLEDGMWSLRAWWVYHGVRLFGDPYADPAIDKPLTLAPKGCEL
ncbi:MAG: hypothetical protein RJA44_242 [Pseudomonadota bacterium]